MTATLEAPKVEAPKLIEEEVRRALRPTDRLANDFLEHDAARSSVAGFEPSDVALGIALEDHRVHRQRRGERVATRVRQRDRSKTTVPDGELSTFDTQVIERLQLFAVKATREDVEVHHRRFFYDALSRMLRAVLLEGDAFHGSAFCGVECDCRRRTDHFERRHGSWLQRQRWLACKLKSQ